MCSCLQCPQLSELVRFCGSSQCLPSWSWGFNLQLYSLWEGFGSSSLVSLPQVSTVILFPPLDVGRPLRFAPEAALEGLGLPCEGQVLGWCSCLSSTRYSGELAARAAGNLVLQKGMAACIDQHAPVFLPREPCLLTEKTGRPQSTRAPGGGHYKSEPVHRHKAFFCPWQLCPSESWGWGGAAAWLAGALAAPSVQGHGPPPLQQWWPYRVSLQASGTWQSEGLFGQPFPVALPVQALRRLPCLGSSSLVWGVRDMEGPLWLGSYSVDRHIRHPKEHPGWVLLCSSGFRWASCRYWPVGRERLCDGPTGYAWLSISSCFHGCPAFLHRHFPPQSPPSHPLDPSLHIQQQPSPSRARLHSPSTPASSLCTI